MIVYLFPFTGQCFAFCVSELIFFKRNEISSSDGIDDGHEVLQADGTVIAGHALLRPAELSNLVSLLVLPGNSGDDSPQIINILVQTDLRVGGSRAEEELGALLKLIACDLTHNISVNLNLINTSPAPADQPTNENSFGNGKQLESNEP